jgi:TRAP-type C4-dicarboxylate transport system substrate-binding protein
MSDLAVNYKRWNALPADLKKVVESAAQEFNRSMITRNGEADRQVAKQAKQLGVEPIDLPKAERRRFREIAEGVWKDYARRSPMAKRVYESQIAYLKQLGLL